MNAPISTETCGASSLQPVVRSRSYYDPAPLAESAGSGGSGRSSKHKPKALDLFGEPLIETRRMAGGGGEQAIYTPDELAVAVVKHFKPAGRICEPCKGGGSFLRAMPGCEWFEIAEGRDFLAAQGRWDWIVTNPPWELVAEFLAKSLQSADNVVLLCWLAALYTRARQRMMRDAGFGMVEMLYVPTPPPPWPQSGFQLAAMWIRRGWTGGVTISHLPEVGGGGAELAADENRGTNEGKAPNVEVRHGGPDAPN